MSEVPGYEDLQIRSSGAFSTVYRARQVAFDRLVAVKILRAAVDDADGRDRFRRECATTGRISNHPNIITVLDSGFTADGRPYLTTDYQSGGSLLDRVNTTGPLTLAEALAITVKIAGALEAAHQADLLHRDLEPGNILFSGFGEPVLTGFGMATVSNEDRTQVGLARVVGVHAAPETLEHAVCTPASDVYSLGSTLYLALAGRAAFQPDKREGTLPLLLRILRDPLPAIDRDDVSPLVMAVLHRAMAKDPADRIPTAADLVRALRSLEDALGLPRTNAVLPAPRTRAPMPPLTLAATGTDAAPSAAAGIVTPTSTIAPTSTITPITPPSEPTPATAANPPATSSTAPAPTSAASPARAPLSAPADVPGPTPLPMPASAPAPTSTPAPTPPSTPAPTPGFAPTPAGGPRPGPAPAPAPAPDIPRYEYAYDDPTVKPPAAGGTAPRPGSAPPAAEPRATSSGGGRARPPMIATPLPSVDGPTIAPSRGIVVNAPDPPASPNSSKIPIIIALAVLLAVAGAVVVLRRSNSPAALSTGTTLSRVAPGSVGTTRLLPPPTTTSNRPIAAWAPPGTPDRVLDALEVAQQFATARDKNHAWDAVLGRDPSVAGQTPDQLATTYGTASDSTVILIAPVEPLDLDVVRLRVAVITHRLADDAPVTAVSCEVWSVAPANGAVNTGAPNARVLDPGTPGTQDPAILIAKVRAQCSAPTAPPTTAAPATNDPAPSPAPSEPTAAPAP